MNRRQALACYAALAQRIASGQQLIGEPPGRIPPVSELITSFEVEAMAQRKLDSLTFSEIAGSDRKALDRITFRPRMMVNTLKLDLTVDLFGQSMFSPILIGPVAQQKRFHPEGELAMARGAAATKCVMVAAANSSTPIDQIAAQAPGLLWYQVYPEADMTAVRSRAQTAINAGCKAVCLTLGDPQHSAGWTSIDRLRDNLSVPLLLKGIMSPEEATAAVKHGVQGIIVSNYRGRSATGLAAPIEVLPSIADAVGGKIPILIDGSFRRGGDIIKAIALGAKAVLLGRPPLWGLAAYGAEGVQHVIQLLQHELAREMSMCGKVKLADLDRTVVRIHRW
jgi:isopentenyl diphosphate isomerase/L-lactate dehydrogenase-like FMN-dependent dehydrogenase